MLPAPRMEPHIRQTQVLSQQIRMTIYMLQLPLLELREYLEQEICENPMLEDARKGEKESTPEEIETLGDTEGTYPDLQRPASYNGEDEEKRRYMETLITKAETLEDHLLWQLGMFVEGKEYEIGEYIIGNLDDNGYLRLTIEELAERLNIERAGIEKVLSLIQTFDPAGIAARDLKECLLIQLRLQGKEGTLAYRMVETCLQDLERKSCKEIARKLGAGPEEGKKARAQINALEPKPGRAYTTEKNAWVIPDVILKEEDDRYSVELNNRYLPVLRISRFYSKLLRDKKTDTLTRAYLRQRQERARWVIKAILQRQDSIKRIAGFILNFQKDFLENPQGRLKPLRMTDVARQLNLSESTVSRTVARKYIQTGMGVLPLKRFFSAGLKKGSGEGVSADSVKARIKEIIGTEDPRRPLSDQRIEDLLKTEGLNIARRTVAKYRESIGILPARLRKRQS